MSLVKAPYKHLSPSKVFSTQLAPEKSMLCYNHSMLQMYNVRAELKNFKPDKGRNCFIYHSFGDGVRLENWRHTTKLQTISGIELTFSARFEVAAFQKFCIVGR